MDFERIFGGSPLAVVIRLVILSVVVGIVLSALGLSPTDLFRSIDRLLQRMYDMGFRWVENLFGYFLVGAVIVIPIWLITRLLNARKSKS